MDLLQTIITVGSIIAAILAWFAKLSWSREFAAAKNATITAKDMQIDQLKEHIKVLQEMTPMKVREYFHSVKEQLEEYNENLKIQILELDNQLRNKDIELKRLKQQLPNENEELAEIFLALKEFDEKSKLGRRAMLKTLSKYKDIATDLLQASIGL